MTHAFPTLFGAWAACIDSNSPALRRDDRGRVLRLSPLASRDFQWNQLVDTLLSSLLQIVIISLSLVGIKISEVKGPSTTPSPLHCQCGAFTEFHDVYLFQNSGLDKLFYFFVELL